jgi:hypothetical protein
MIKKKKKGKKQEKEKEKRLLVALFQKTKNPVRKVLFLSFENELN